LTNKAVETTFSTWAQAVDSVHTEYVPMYVSLFIWTQRHVDFHVMDTIFSFLPFTWGL